MRIVDPDERRQAIATTAMRLIAQEGLEAATLGRIAGEMHASIRVITHYFADKDSLLLWVYRSMAMQGQVRIEAVRARDPAGLVEVLIGMCGEDETMIDQWRIYMAFWDKSARNAVFAAEQRRWIDRTVEIVCDVIVAATGADAGVRADAHELLALVHGIAIQRALVPESWTTAAIREVIARRAGAITGPAPRAATAA